MVMFAYVLYSLPIETNGRRNGNCPFFHKAFDSKQKAIEYASKNFSKAGDSTWYYETENNIWEVYYAQIPWRGEK